jgi:hypothetical protein
MVSPVVTSPIDPAAAFAVPQSAATENVRDPCLVSWDPQCVEKHAADYHPRWGYAPTLIRSAGRSDRPAAATEHSAQTR